MENAMQRGDKLYHITSTADIEVVTFLEESIVEGASSPTWLCRRNGGTFRCSIGMYQKTEAEAWLEFVRMLRVTITRSNDYLRSLETLRMDTLALLDKAEERVMGLFSERK